MLSQNYRTSDPVTSKIAGIAVTKSGKRQSNTATAISVVEKYPGHTSAELANKTGAMDRYEFARRLADARNQGALSNGESRRCNATGKTALTWYPV